MLMILEHECRRFVSAGSDTSQREIPSQAQLGSLLTCRLVAVREHLAEHQLVGVFPEWVPEQSYWDQEHVAVGTI